ncbi:TetR family transcriptional regulator [Hyphomicrobium methylovorum]|uniref:TetR/AcrR family transcriptional regulator n=1 Tax=Hyphomicrobium methylovorum TaxID=84 RepID=UPI0015E6ED69|nr:TetR/AcrR family transcriptional regulator [Hyphomicrobium methylovorum]MBA2126501.1 TetR family transcriptional regulator [Hyphomicrobium methylovorum]
MDWDEGTRGARRGYHHGNLREALMKAALELISAKGPSGFTFAEAARAAGVSPAAPYRHYRDRDALMADVARHAFELFETKLRKAWNGGAPDPFAAFERVGHAYLAFAREAPAQYSAMFESGLSFQAFPELHIAGERAFDVLKEACAALVAKMPDDKKRPPVMMMALHIWSQAHGIASLFARGDEARRPIPMTPNDLLDAAVLIYLDGLGLRRKAP